MKKTLKVIFYTVMLGIFLLSCALSVQKIVTLSDVKEVEYSTGDLPFSKKKITKKEDIKEINTIIQKMEDEQTPATYHDLTHADYRLFIIFNNGGSDFVELFKEGDSIVLESTVYSNKYTLSKEDGKKLMAIIEK